MLGLAKLIPGFDVISKFPLLHMPLNAPDTSTVAQQAIAGKSAITAGQVGRDVAAYNVPDLLNVAQRAHLVSHELDHFRKLLERFILGADVTTFDPVVNAPSIEPVHLKVTVTKPIVPPLQKFTAPKPLQASVEDMAMLTFGWRRPCTGNSRINEFL